MKMFHLTLMTLQLQTYGNKVTQLWLYQNQLCGPLPDAFGSLTELTSLRLGANKFYAPIPDAVGFLSELRLLSLAHAHLTESIPDAIGAWSKTHKISVDSNHLIGPIPDGIGFMARLVALYMEKNTLSGRIPDGIGQLSSTREIHSEENKLGGPIPDGIGSMQLLVNLYIFQNELGGALPNAMSLMSGLRLLVANRNQLRGPLPDELGSWLLLEFFEVIENDIRGPIPSAVISMSNLREFFVDLNSLSGHIPTSLCFLLNLQRVHLEGNRLSGHVPDAVSSMSNLQWIISSANQLSGCIPKSIGSMEELRGFHLDANQLSGAIPDMICHAGQLASIVLSTNYLSGPLPTCMSNLLEIFFVLLDDNRLAGSISAANMPVQVWQLQASWNLFEGIVPHIPVTLMILGVTPSSPGPQLHGPIPKCLARLRKLEVLVAQGHRLEGDVFALASSVKVLVLHDNLLKRIFHTRFQNGSHIFSQHNALSCRLPSTLDGEVQPSTSVCAVGNQLQRPSPDWLLSYDSNGIFWSSGHEGSAILIKLGGVTMMLAASVRAKHDWRQNVAALTTWYHKPGCQYLLKVCASQLQHVSCRAVVCVLFIMALVDWTLYTCPRTLTLASACHVDGSAEMQWAVVLLWFEFSVRWHFLLGRWKSQASSSGGSLEQHRRMWVVWIILMFPLSSLAMLNMSSMCIPDFLQIGGFWLKLVNLVIGACQGLISNLVIPRLAGALTPVKHFYTSAASILTAVCFPAACIVYFDHACFGQWTAWWGPCSWKKRQQFDLHDALLPEVGGSRRTFRLMKAEELCTPSLGESASICTMVTVLKMQEMLIEKVMTSSLVIPLRDIIRERHTNDSAMLIVQIGLPVQLAMLFSGMLPLLMPILWLAWVCLTLLIAIVKQGQMQNEARAGDLLSQISSMGLALSALLHVAFASASSWAAVVCSAFAIAILKVLSCRIDEREEL